MRPSPPLNLTYQLEHVEPCVGYAAALAADEEVRLDSTKHPEEGERQPQQRRAVNTVSEVRRLSVPGQVRILQRKQTTRAKG